ncbi:hypothetical protein AB0K15_21170 [Amycolatopsis sp. NPDC049253]|uniref:hypothetical protein n=1 Tax=Amycolatopsis sp. NPDC049253 TaxID=3155274 RepID=UPI00343401F9
MVMDPAINVGVRLESLPAARTTSAASEVTSLVRIGDRHRDDVRVNLAVVQPGRDFGLLLQRRQPGRGRAPDYGRAAKVGVSPYGIREQLAVGQGLAGGRDGHLRLDVVVRATLGDNHPRGSNPAGRRMVRAAAGRDNPGAPHRFKPTM